MVEEVHIDILPSGLVAIFRPIELDTVQDLDNPHAIHQCDVNFASDGSGDSRTQHLHMHTLLER